MQVEVKSLGFDALIRPRASGQIDMIASGMELRRNDRNKFPLQNRTSRTAIPSSSARITTPFTALMTSKGRTVGTQVGTKGVDLGTEAGATVKQYDANSRLDGTAEQHL